MSRLRGSLVGGMTALAIMAGAAAADDARFVSWTYSEVAGKAFIEGEVGKIDGVTVEMIGFPWNQMVQNVILRYRSGEPTEVVQLQERWLPLLNGMGALTDLNETIGSGKLADAIDPNLLAMGQVDGKQVGVPWTAASIALIANRSVLGKAGITKMPQTMDEFHAALKAIKEKVPDSVPFGLSTANPNLIQVESQIIFWQFGAHFFQDGKVAIDSPEARQALQFLVDLVNEGLIAKGNDRNATRALFAQELVGFYFDPPVARGFARELTGQGAAYDANIAVVPTPTMDNDEPPRSVSWAHFLGSMNSGSPDISGAARVIEHFALNPDVQMTYWEQFGLFPTTKQAIEQLSDDPYVTNWIEIAGTALPDEPSAFENSAELTRIIGEEIEAALLGTKSADQAITDMAQRLNGAL